MALDLAPIFAQIRAGDPVGAAYRLGTTLGSTAAGRLFHEAGKAALDRWEELGDDALRFARLVFAEAVEREAGLGEAQRDLATTMYNLGVLDDAVPHFVRALELLPDDEEALIGLASARADQGQLDQAVELLRRATEAHPASAGAQAHYAITLEAVGRDAEAAAAFGRAAARFEAKLEEAGTDGEVSEARDQRRWAWVQLAAVLERLQRWPQAISVLRRIYEGERALESAEPGREHDLEAALDTIEVAQAGGDREHPEPEAPDEGTTEGGASSPFIASIEEMLHLSPDESVEPEAWIADAAAAAEADRTEHAHRTGSRHGIAGAPGQAAVPTSEDESAPDEATSPEHDDAALDPANNPDAGKHGLERIFSRLIQIRRFDLAYLVLDDLGGELADPRTRATYTIYEPDDGPPTIMMQRWDDGTRARLEPEAPPRDQSATTE